MRLLLVIRLGDERFGAPGKHLPPGGLGGWPLGLGFGGIFGLAFGEFGV